MRELIINILKTLWHELDYREDQDKLCHKLWINLLFTKKAQNNVDSRRLHTLQDPTAGGCKGYDVYPFK